VELWVRAFENLWQNKETVLLLLTGLVRSPLFSNIVQVSSRVFVLWAIVYSFPEVRFFFLLIFEKYLLGPSAASGG
jgi:hypothetical protein